MIFAIPYQNERIAGHFTKAEQFLFTDQNTSELKENPALRGEGCGGKKSLLALLKSQHTDVVLIRNIGEKMLANLLKANIRVFRTNGRISLETVNLSNLTELTKPSQGRPCKNTKQGCCSKNKTASIQPTILNSPTALVRKFTIFGVK